MRFRLLEGQHVQNDAHGNKVKFSARSNNIVESATDLCDRFNTKDPHFPRKFERIDGHEQGAGYEEAIAAAYRKGMEDARTAAATPATPSPVAAAAQQGFNTLYTDSGGKPPQSDSLDRMTVKELQELAAEEEIKLGNAKSKEEIIKAIRAAV